jgi:hypothetical protein
MESKSKGGEVKGDKTKSKEAHIGNLASEVSAQRDSLMITLLLLDYYANITSYIY